jgi:hypothetical protein
MVVVGGEDDVLVGQIWVVPGQARQHVRRTGRVEVCRELQVERDAQRRGTERGALGALNKRVEIVSAERGDPGRGIFGHPGSKARPWLIGRGRQLQLRPAEPALDDLPRVARGRRGVNDDRAGSAQLRRDFVLVAPAAVVESRVAGESIPHGVVVQEQQDLALNVHAFVVVPTLLGCHNPIADKDDLGAFDRAAARLTSGPADPLAVVGEGDRLSVAI